MTGYTSLLMTAHVGLGTLAVLTGAMALAVRKGGKTHIGAGRVFVLTMGLASLFGALLGLIKIDSFYITFHAGILGLTLIISSWLTIRKPQLGKMSVIISLINGINFLALIGVGLYSLSLPQSTWLGFHGADYLFLSAMAGIVVLCDFSLLFRKPLTGKHRIARHLWRMCLGFFIAAGSAFTGPGASAFPESVQNSGILSVPELIILIAMLFWLARTLLRKEKQSEPQS